MSSPREQAHQDSLELQQGAGTAGPVECLGQTFENDHARREHFLALLKEKLQDPEFRKIPGFPKGSDEDILRISDPPYFTACPNPWTKDFVDAWNSDKVPEEDSYSFQRKPFAGDVSEGKYDPTYRMHPYHTKVPPKAIMRYILHYTNPGDVIFDGFSGTGMTGVAAKMCADRREVTSLGYQVSDEGIISRREIDENGQETWIPFSALGKRNTILSDLSPAASFIAWNYNTPVDGVSIRKKTNNIIESAVKKYGWMFETKHMGGAIGVIDYVIWSDVSTCPQCSADIVFWETAVDIEHGKVRDKFNCPSCNIELTKRLLDKKWTTIFDQSIQEKITIVKQVPVQISYTVGNGRFTKKPDLDDLRKIDDTEAIRLDDWYPVDQLPKGVNTAQPIASHGLARVHQFYSRRNLAILAAFNAIAAPNELSTLTAVALRITKRYALTYQSGVWGAGGGPTNGTYYIPALVKELNIANMMMAAAKKQAEGRMGISKSDRSSSVISVQSAEGIFAEEDSVDYIFIDPPFGSNLNYSELNFLWESWLRVWTNNKLEAIENKVQKKGIDEYRQLMTNCLKNAYKMLKPGKWITIEFSNTSALVWNNIQTSLIEAGFIVANVSALDKQKGSFKALTSPTAVKQDLVISAYKPSADFESRFTLDSESEEGVWDFIRSHLSFLPVLKYQNGKLQSIPERDPRILFDRMLSFYVRRGMSVPLSSTEFQNGLRQRFSERDDMFFLQDQVIEYDRQKVRTGEPEQESLFIFDEVTAIQWVRKTLKRKPQIFSELNHLYIQSISGWSRNEIKLDLREILAQNFICYEGEEMIPPQITSWLRKGSIWRISIEKEAMATGQILEQLSSLPFKTSNSELRDFVASLWYVPNPERQADLERLREHALLREFQSYASSSQKKLKVTRAESIRVGFKECWKRKDYLKIVSVSHKLPDSLLREDEQILMYFDNSITRLGDDA